MANDPKDNLTAESDPTDYAEAVPERKEPPEPKLPLNPEELAHKIVRILDSKKASSIKLLQVEKQTIIADYFVICTGNSNTQIKGLSNELELKLDEQNGIEPRNIEGYNAASWVLLDYGSVIVHIFSRETRSFYNLEKLWADAAEVDISEILKDNEATAEPAAPAETK